MSELHIAVCGLGVFGRNHLRIYRLLRQSGRRVIPAALIDTNPQVNPQVATDVSPQPDLAENSQNGAPETADAIPIPFFSSVHDCLAAVSSGRLHIDAVSVCVPTVEHCSVALAFLEAGVDVLIEKPIASTLAEADRLIEAADRNGRILQVGHIERFNPAVQAMRSRITRPMFFETHRLSVFTPRSLDVDVVLDLMIHDLDVVLSVVSSPVSFLHAVGLPVISRTADIASVRIEFESGCVANLTASRVSTERVRKLRLFQPYQYLSVDFARQDLIVIAVDPEAPPGAALAAHAHSAPGPLPPGLTLQKPDIQPGEPLRLELESFLTAVRTRRSPEVTGLDGRRSLELALRIQEQIRQHRQRAQIPSPGA